MTALTSSMSVGFIQVQELVASGTLDKTSQATIQFLV